MAILAWIISLSMNYNIPKGVTSWTRIAFQYLIFWTATQTCKLGVQAKLSTKHCTNTKNTQKEDSEPRELVAKQVIRRLIRAQDAEKEHEASGEDIEEGVNDWVEGLSRVLTGINAATSRTVVSGPITHNLAI